MKPEISIIVPVYNVEKYLRKCIDSILAQTFTNFELILIDDGSLDNCGKICDEYAEKDKRVVVIHKENGGQSSARNLGLDIAKGEYIGFVDSDDWIEPDMYEALYNLILRSGKDIANIGFTVIRANSSEVWSTHSEIDLNRDKALEELIKNKLYGNYFWANLFKSSLIEKFRFREGIIFEDVDLMYKIMYASNGIITSGKVKYNYLQRKESTVAEASKKLDISFIDILNQRKNTIKKKYNQVYRKNKKNINDYLSYCSLTYLNNYIKQEMEDLKYISSKHLDFYRIVKIINNCFCYNLFSKKFNLKEKIMLISLRINPNFYLYLLKLKKKGSIKLNI